MLTKSIAFAGIAAAGIAAAGVGSYLAVRQNALSPTAIAVGADGARAVATIDQTADGLVVEATDAMVDRAERGERDAPVETDAVDRDAATDLGAATEAPVAPVDQPAPPTAAAAPPPPPPPPRATPAPPRAPAESAPRPAPADRSPATPPPPPVPVAAPDVPDAGEPAPAPATVEDLPAVEGWSRVDGAPPSPGPWAEPPPLDATGVGPLRARDDRASNEWTDGRAEPEPMPAFVDLEIAADSVIGLQIDTAISTRTARVEDRVEASVIRDVHVADRVAIPAGTRMLGSVVLVEQGGRLRDASRLGVRFHTLVMDDGYRVPVVTETIYREGKPAGSDSVAKIGGAAVGGAILGAIFGGSRGAAIGGSIGAAGGTAAALNGEAEPAGLPPGSRLTVRLSEPAVVTVEP